METGGRVRRGGARLCAAGLWLGANKLFNEAIRRKQTSPDGGEDAADVRLRAALRAEGRAYLDSVPHEFWRMQSFDGLSLVAEYIPAAVPHAAHAAVHPRLHLHRPAGVFRPWPARCARRVQPYFAGRPRPRPKARANMWALAPPTSGTALPGPMRRSGASPVRAGAVRHLDGGGHRAAGRGQRGPCPRVCAALWKTAATPAPRMSSAIRCAPWRMCRPGRFCRLPTVCAAARRVTITARPMPWPPCAHPRAGAVHPRRRGCLCAHLDGPRAV